MGSGRTRGQIGLGFEPQSGSVWLDLRMGWKPLEATERGREEALLFPANHLNHLRVVTITNPWVFWSF